MIASISNGGSHGPPHQPHQTLHHQHLRPRSRRSDQPARRRPVALGGHGGRLEPRRAARLSQVPRALLAVGVRLAGTGGGDQRAAAVHHRDRRADLSLRPREIRQARRPADRPLPWLAGVVCRVSAACRAVDQRWVRRRDPLASGLWLFVAARLARLGSCAHDACLCRDHVAAGLRRSMRPTAAISAPGLRGILHRSIPTASIGVHVASERNTLVQCRRLPAAAG